MIECCESEYFVEAIFEKIGKRLEKRRREVNSIFASNSRRQAQARADELRKWLQELIQIDFVSCPLETKRTGEIDCGEYVIEKILYQTFPGSYVPGNVYRPKFCTGKLPAVLVPIGHWPEGKALPENQILCANLCKNGFVVLSFDPQYQGERANLEDDFSDLDRADYICVANHMKAALPQYLIGRKYAAHYLWDGIRGLDYLCTRADVDTERIGCMGQSGGGTQTSFIMALDPRVKVASVMQYLTSAEEDLHWNGVGEAEQATFGLQEFGFDKADLVWMVAPRPVLVNAALRDNIFPIEGAMRIKDELNELYSLYGVPERVNMAVSDSRHEIHQQTREGCYYWMNKWLRKQEGFRPEENVKIFSQDELSCGYATINQWDAIDWNRQELARLKKEKELRNNPDCKTELINFFSNVERESYRYYSVAQHKCDHYECTDFRISTANSYDFDGTFYCRDFGEKRLTVLLDLEQQGINPVQLLERGNVLELKPFGMNYTFRKSHKIRFDTQSMAVQTIFASGTDMISVRVNEVLCALEHANLTMGGISEIMFETTGQGGILAMIAALFENRTIEIHTNHMLASYADVVANRNTFINDADIIVGFLEKFDVVDLIRANENVRINSCHPINAYGNEMDAVDIDIRKA
ncbi:MAG: prolyl oligopeptidase family serine peptidase [Clostridia bacterium]